MQFKQPPQHRWVRFKSQRILTYVILPLFFLFFSFFFWLLLLLSLADLYSWQPTRRDRASLYVCVTLNSHSSIRALWVYHIIKIFFLTCFCVYLTSPCVCLCSVHICGIAHLSALVQCLIFFLLFPTGYTFLVKCSSESVLTASGLQDHLQLVIDCLAEKQSGWWIDCQSFTSVQVLMDML